MRSVACTLHKLKLAVVNYIFRPATIFVYGELDWDKFHLMISRSTTPDLIKMGTKLEEFFAQQLNSSKRVLSLIPGGTKQPKKRRDNEEGNDTSLI